ncbi:MAG TPA: hypothetical protein PKA02_03395 [Candidatus Saccharibacteria bacterium]|nr:hypothetical protein [Candidatus Saccharibacteria bacterium]
MPEQAAPFEAITRLEKAAAALGLVGGAVVGPMVAIDYLSPQIAENDRIDTKLAPLEAKKAKLHKQLDIATTYREEIAKDEETPTVSANIETLRQEESSVANSRAEIAAQKHLNVTPDAIAIVGGIELGSVLVFAGIAHGIRRLKHGRFPIVSKLFHLTSQE